MAVAAGESQPGCSSSSGPGLSPRTCRAWTAMAAAKARSAASCTTTLSSWQAASSSAVGGRWRLGERVIQAKRPLSGSTPLVSRCSGRPKGSKAWQRGPRLWCRGSPPVITTKAAPAAVAAAVSAISSAGERLGCCSAGQECLVSHQEQATAQPPRRMKKALRPAWSPSPCKEWKVSTTGRVPAGSESAARGRGTGLWQTECPVWASAWHFF